MPSIEDIEDFWPLVRPIRQAVLVTPEAKVQEPNLINLYCDGRSKIFALWVETMREVAQETLSPESIDLFFSRFSIAMEDWEERAQSALELP